MSSVKITAGGTTVTVDVPEGSTIRDALEAANITLGGAQRTAINGEAAGLDTPVQNGDRIQAAGNKASGY